MLLNVKQYSDIST